MKRDPGASASRNAIRLMARDCEMLPQGQRRAATAGFMPLMFLSVWCPTVLDPAKPVIVADLGGFDRVGSPRTCAGGEEMASNITVNLRCCLPVEMLSAGFGRNGSSARIKVHGGGKTTSVLNDLAGSSDARKPVHQGRFPWCPVTRRCRGNAANDGVPVALRNRMGHRHPYPWLSPGYLPACDQDPWQSP